MFNLTDYSFIYWWLCAPHPLKEFTDQKTVFMSLYNLFYVTWPGTAGVK